MYPAISRYDIPRWEYRSPTNTPPSSWFRSRSDQDTTYLSTAWVRKMCRSSGWIVPLASTALDRSSVGISFSTGLTYSRLAVISMPSSAIALLDDQDVVVRRPRTGLGPHRRRGRTGGHGGSVVVDDEDV